VAKLTQTRNQKAKEIESVYNQLGKGVAKIKVGDIELSIGKLYRYKTENGIKTIKVIGESTDEGKVKLFLLMVIVKIKNKISQLQI
jgi:hypothetical protein